MARTYSEAERAELRKATLRVLNGGPRELPGNPERDWIGNRKGTMAYQLNDKLIDGATADELFIIRPTYKAHLYRLEKGMGIPIECQNGRYKFDKLRL